MRVWLYYRLSRDEDAEMNSLTNQRNILVEYANANNYQIVGESFDDNVSGMHFNREGISKIYEQVEQKNIDAVIVKDLSCKQVGSQKQHTEGHRQKMQPVQKSIFTPSEIHSCQGYNIQTHQIGHTIVQQKIGIVVKIPMWNRPLHNMRVADGAGNVKKGRQKTHCQKRQKDLVLSLMQSLFHNGKQNGKQRDRHGTDIVMDIIDHCISPPCQYRPVSAGAETGLFLILVWLRSITLLHMKSGTMLVLVFLT